MSKVPEHPFIPSMIGMLHDVDVSTAVPTSGQALLWNSTDKKWEPGSVGGFDANEDPVIIGAGATAGAGSTPSSPAGGQSGSVAVGLNASATGSPSLALCYAATASADDAMAGGDSASASGLAAIAWGAHANAAGDNGSAWGPFANAGNNNSTAVGYKANTTAANQIMLGYDSALFTPGIFVELCRYNNTYGSILVMKSPNSTRWALQIDNSGNVSAIASPV